MRLVVRMVGRPLASVRATRTVVDQLDLLAAGHHLAARALHAPRRSRCRGTGSGPAGQVGDVAGLEVFEAFGGHPVLQAAIGLELYAAGVLNVEVDGAFARRRAAASMKLSGRMFQ